MSLIHYEEDDKSFPASAYSVPKTWGRGIAWQILGWEVVPDNDTEWTGIKVRTGMVVAMMVGDDSRFIFEPEDFVPLDEEAYCGGCGQIGCGY